MRHIVVDVQAQDALVVGASSDPEGDPVVDREVNRKRLLVVAEYGADDGSPIDKALPLEMQRSCVSEHSASDAVQLPQA